MTLKNTSYTGASSFFVPLLRCGLIPYLGSPKRGSFPQIGSSGGGVGHQDRVSATRLFRDGHHHSIPSRLRQATQ